MGWRSEMVDRVVQEQVVYVVCDLCKAEVSESKSDPPVTWASVVHQLRFNYSERFVICSECFAKLGLKLED